MNIVHAGTSARMTGTYCMYPDLVSSPPLSFLLYIHFPTLTQQIFMRFLKLFEIMRFLKLFEIVLAVEFFFKTLE